MLYTIPIVGDDEDNGASAPPPEKEKDKQPKQKEKQPASLKGPARATAEQSTVLPPVSDTAELNYPAFSSDLDLMKERGADDFHLPNYGSYRRIVEHVHDIAGFQLRAVSVNYYFH